MGPLVAGHLSDDAVVALLEGRLPPADLQALLDHIDACPDCLALVMQMDSPSFAHIRRGSSPCVHPSTPVQAPRPLHADPPARTGGHRPGLAGPRQNLGRDVALKELRPERASGALTLRPASSKEARITGQLEHPGIVPIYELARRCRRQALLHHAVHPRPHAERGHRGDYHRKRGGRAGPAARAARAADRLHRHLQRRRLRPLARRDPPRSQAGQRHARRLRRGRWCSTGAWPSCSASRGRGRGTPRSLSRQWRWHRRRGTGRYKGR